MGAAGHPGLQVDQTRLWSPLLGRSASCHESARLRVQRKVRLLLQESRSWSVDVCSSKVSMDAYGSVSCILSVVKFSFPFCGTVAEKFVA